MQLRRAIWAVMLWVAAAAQAAATQVSTSGFVVDMAGVLEPDTMLEIDSALARYSESTGFIFSVLTLTDVADETLENVARVSLRNMVEAMADPQARVMLLLWSSAGQIVIARNDVHGRELSATEVERVLRAELLPQIGVGDIGAGLLRGVYGLIVAVSEPSDESRNPSELVMMARWDGAGAPAPVIEQDAMPLRAPPRGPDMTALAQAFRDDPSAALGASRDRVREQWTFLRTRIGELAAALRAGTDGNAFVFAIAGLVLLAVLAGAWRATRGLSAPAVLAGLAAAVLCWGLTGYIELSLVLALSGVAFAIAWRLLRLLLTRSDEARLQPGPYAPASRMPSPRSTAMSSPVQAKPAPVAVARAAERADTPHRSGADFRSSLARAHRDGIRTPMLDYLIANKDKLKAAAAGHKKQRQYWMIGIAISFFLLFPLALLLLLAWIVTELNRLKPPQVSLADFVRQVVAEAQAVARHRPAHG